MLQNDRREYINNYLKRMAGIHALMGASPEYDIINELVQHSNELERGGLVGLWKSTAALHARFGSRQTVREALACFVEETREFEQAMYHRDGMTHEAVDVLVTVMGCLMAAGMTLDDLRLGVEAVIAKNDSKDSTTHALNEHGKIQRIGR